jgi:predicted acetyltransferase
MGLEVRTITDDEVPAFCAANNRGFLVPSADADAEAEAEARRPGMYLDRTWAGFDGSAMVSTLRSFPTDLTVPGGRTVSASAVTAVTTTSTHRRRGLATRMVLGELAASRDRGEVTSVLIAAEWPIYGRFGYGAATEHQTFTMDRRLARLRDRPQGTVQYVDDDTGRALAPEVYERHRLATPGELARPDRFWDLDFGMLRLPSRPAPKPAFTVVARDPDGALVGLARYTFEDSWLDRQPNGRADVSALIASEPVGAALLWDHFLALDMARTVRATDRAADETLPWLLTDARHAQASDRADLLWLRPLDVPALLETRAYGVAGNLVLEVVDPAGFAAGRFALDAGADGATCNPTTASADLTLGVGVLGTVCLGGHGLRMLAAAGLVDEHAPDAIGRADRMFRADRAPWCTTWF